MTKTRRTWPKSATRKNTWPSRGWDPRPRWWRDVILGTTIPNTGAHHPPPCTTIELLIRFRKNKLVRLIFRPLTSRRLITPARGADSPLSFTQAATVRVTRVVSYENLFSAPCCFTTIELGNKGSCMEAAEKRGKPGGGKNKFLILCNGVTRLCGKDLLRRKSTSTACWLSTCGLIRLPVSRPANELCYRQYLL